MKFDFWWKITTTIQHVLPAENQAVGVSDKKTIVVYLYYLVDIVRYEIIWPPDFLIFCTMWSFNVEAVSKKKKCYVRQFNKMQHCITVS